MIDAFISNVKTRGLARTNRFQIYIGFPAGTVVPYTGVLSSLFCEVAGLPGYNIATQPHRTIGEAREVPYEPMYDPINLTFYMDSSFEIKDAFETWMSYIIDPITKTHGYYSQYVSNISILVENVDQSVPYRVELFEAYPKSMQTITLDQNGKDVMRLNIGIAYKYWRSVSLYGTSRYNPITYVNESDRQEVTTGTGDPTIQGNSGYRR
jgi:hypothetical protein